MKHVFLTSLQLLLIWSAASAGQVASTQLLLKTVAGEITAAESGPLKYRIALAGKIILELEGTPPSVLKHVRQRIAPFDEVVVLQQQEGSYCVGGRFWFLGVKRDGAFQLSQGIGSCFAHEPVVLVGSNFVKVSVGSGWGRRHLPGEPYLRGGSWLYRNGRITNIRVRPVS